jgi:hypothetical protein
MNYQAILNTQRPWLASLLQRQKDLQARYRQGKISAVRFKADTSELNGKIRGAKQAIEGAEAALARLRSQHEGGSSSEAAPEV